MKLLWVEDEARIVESVIPFLEEENCQVTHVMDAVNTMAALKKQTYDLILIDWMLPDKSGIDLCKDVQQQWNIPAIMITAKTDEWHKVIALEIGADDYITKPFGMRELLARIRAVLRRAGQLKTGEEKVIRSGALTIDSLRHEVRIHEELVTLTPTEFDILHTLASQPGRTFSRLQLIDHILGEAYFGYERTIDSHIRNLRRKIEEDTSQPTYVVTVYGIGYKFGGGAS